MAGRRLEKVIGTIIVLIVVLGFLRCVEGLRLVPDGNGSGGAGGDDAGIAGAGGDGGRGGSSGQGGEGGSTQARCDDGICQELEDVSSCAADCDYDVIVIVDSSISNTLATSLQSYTEDLAAEGRRARIEPWEPGTVEALKALLFDRVDRFAVEGALLVGNLPAAFYEQAVICLAFDRLGRCVMYEHEEFPTDVYLGDRNAQWEDADGDGVLDAHGELELEIFVSRLQVLPQAEKCTKTSLFPDCPEPYDPSAQFYASEECVATCPSMLVPQVWQELEPGDAQCCGPYFLRRYFERLHRYRTLGALTDRKAVVFADDDFVDMVFPTGLETIYAEAEVLTDPTETTRDVYTGRLAGGGVEHVHHYLHSTVRNFYFYSCREWDAETKPADCIDWYPPERIYRTEIGPGPGTPRYDLRASFFTMYDCHASRFTEPNLGMAVTLQTDYGLATVGNTRKGGMKDATVFHRELARGASWGEAYLRWYNEIGRYDDRWYLGVVLTGDPMLTTPAVAERLPAVGLPKQQGEPVETSSEPLENDPLGTFEEYRRLNPQFFED